MTEMRFVCGECGEPTKDYPYFGTAHIQSSRPDNCPSCGVKWPTGKEYQPLKEKDDHRNTQNI